MIKANEVKIGEEEGALYDCNNCYCHLVSPCGNCIGDGAFNGLFCPVLIWGDQNEKEAGDAD